MAESSSVGKIQEYHRDLTLMTESLQENSNARCGLTESSWISMAGKSFAGRRLDTT